MGNAPIALGNLSPGTGRSIGIDGAIRVEYSAVSLKPFRDNRSCVLVERMQPGTDPTGRTGVVSPPNALVAGHKSIVT
jgi:hypothetical protein